MKERPIIFKGEMVRAILDGRKTQTRRVIKPQPVCDLDGAYFDAYNDGPQWNWWLPDGRMCKGHDIVRCPFGAPGDLLWVRECWTIFEPPLEYEGGCNIEESLKGINNDYLKRCEVAYRADGEQDGPVRWRPSIHMPRWASRITLEVKDVRVERVQDISAKDAKKEGDKERSGHPEFYAFGPECHRRWFSHLWNSINAKRGYSWESNPWVWVVEFEVTK